MALSNPVADAFDCLNLIDERISWLSAIAELLRSQGESKCLTLSENDLGNTGWLMAELLGEMREASDLAAKFYPTKKEGTA